MYTNKEIHTAKLRRGFVLEIWQRHEGFCYTANVEIFVVPIFRGLNFPGDEFSWVQFSWVLLDHAHSPQRKYLRLWYALTSKALT